MKVDLYTDGGARGNPGPAGIGGVLYDQETDEIVRRFSEYMGKATNNQAEYQALIRGLEECKYIEAAVIHCFLDSELIVQQLNGNYKVKNQGLKPLFNRVQELRLEFASVLFDHVPREQNVEADRLVNQALDRELGR